MAISATVALIIGNILGLQYATVGAVIAILSIQDTRKKALIVSYRRIVACTIGVFLSVILYKVAGNSSIAFGMFLLILIPITSKLKVQEGMVPAVVLSTHILVAESIIPSLVVNELLLNASQRSYVQLGTEVVVVCLNLLASVLLINQGYSIQIVKLVAGLIYLIRPVSLSFYVKKHFER